LLAAVSDMCGQPGPEAEELSSLFRSAGWDSAALRRLAAAEAHSNETLDPVLVRAERLRQVEGAAAIDCRHLLLAVIQQPSPDLLRQLAGAGVAADALFARTVTIKAPVRRARPGAESGRHMLEYYRGRLLDDRYRVLDGAFGGMGCVLFCLDREAGRPVALKLCTAASSPESLLEEARKWILLGAHPHIVRALYAGQLPAPPPIYEFEPIRYIAPSPGNPHRNPPTGFRPAGPTVYIALEMIAKSTNTGCSLRNWLNGAHRLPSSTILKWAFQIASALEYASSRHGLIHQDVKPDNILITPAGDAKLTDFGVSSRVGGSHVVGGTPVYMAPEHRAGRPSVQSDIYSFGITLAESFLGHIRPEYLALIRGGEPGAFSEKQLAMLIFQGRPKDEPAAAPLCLALARLVRTCTAVDPARRYPDFRRLQHALAGLTRAYLGMELRATQPRPETSVSDELLNQGLALLWLQPGNQDTAYAARLLLQATLQSPTNPVAIGFSRRFLSHDARKLLRFVRQHARLGMRTLRWWSWLLGAVALFVLLLSKSPEAAVTKISDTILVLVLAVEAYVNFLSGRNLDVLALGIAAVCAILYAVR
jgi:serine/threonine protein kinase